MNKSENPLSPAFKLGGEKVELKPADRSESIFSTSMPLTPTVITR